MRKHRGVIAATVLLMVMSGQPVGATSEGFATGAYEVACVEGAGQVTVTVTLDDDAPEPSGGDWIIGELSDNPDHLGFPFFEKSAENMPAPGGSVVVAREGLEDGSWRLVVGVDLGEQTGHVINEVFEVSCAQFSDVLADHPFAAEIAWLVDEGIATGFPDDTFRPTQPVTRQAVAAFLYRWAGEPDIDGTSGFDDVPDDHPFHDEITWLVNESITTGFPDDTFRPANEVTRQAVAAFLYRKLAGGEPPGQPLGVSWERADDGETFEDVRLNAIVEGGPGFVAVGRGGGPVVFTATDGSEWTPAPSNPEVFGEEEANGIWDVTVGGPGFVAVGDHVSAAGREGAIWTSADGLEWERQAETLPLSDVELFGVTADGPGLVAVGHQNRPNADPLPAILTSSDGIDWEMISHDPDGQPQDQGGSSIRAVTPVGDGLVAVGNDGFAAAAWYSEDGGSSWTYSPPEGDLGQGPLFAVTDSEHGVVAVGRFGIPFVSLWRSQDAGATWEFVAPPDTDPYQEAIVTTTEGLVTVGPSAAYVSSDGADWVREPQAWNAMYDVIYANGRLIAVGFEQVWVSEG